MKKKIVMVSILAVFMLVSISFVSSAVVNTDAEEKESPLYGIRSKQVISEKISSIINNIKSRFIGNRIFFLPLQRTIVIRMPAKFDNKVTCGVQHPPCLPTAM